MTSSLSTPLRCASPDRCRNTSLTVTSDLPLAPNSGQYSATKGLAATVIHRLVDRGLLSYDAPVAENTIAPVSAVQGTLPCRSDHPVQTSTTWRPSI